MNSWWVSDWYAVSHVLLYSWVLWVVISICLHELGHGYAAISRGDRTPIELGHMTANPLVHIPGMAWVMFAMFGFTWGLMPVNPSRMRGRYGHAFVAFAGPLVNLALAVLCILGAALWNKFSGGIADNVRQNAFTFLWTGAMINTMGFVFNLIPVPPLDGGTIARELIPAYDRALDGPNAQWIGLAAFAFVFFVASKYAWGVAMLVASLGISIASMLLGIPSDQMLDPFARN